MTTAMITTASTPTAAEPDAQAITSQIVNLYRSGQSQQAEDYAIWAWGNHFHVTIKMFADEWASVVQAPEKNAIVESDEGTDGQKRKVLEDAMTRYLDKMAAERFGERLEHWRAFAEHLEQMSEDARNKHFDRLFTGDGIFEDVWELYSNVYKAITPLFMTYFAPRAMHPDDFVYACACETVCGQMPRMSCPACDSGQFYYNEAVTPVITDDSLRVNLFCEDCGFPLDAVIEFT